MTETKLNSWYWISQRHSILSRKSARSCLLGPLCFLLYVNDMGNNISSNLKLFADDTLLYGLNHDATDALHLKRDLDSLVTWAQEWQMNFHPSKCYVLRIYRIKNPTMHHYTILDQTLKVVDHQPYLSITLSKTLWRIKGIGPWAALIGISSRVQKELKHKHKPP